MEVEPWNYLLRSHSTEMSSPTGATNSAVLRPWRLFLNLSAISVPLSLSESSYRIGLNFRFFLANYAVLTLFVFLLTLLARPLPLIFFISIFAAWFYLIFCREEPLTVLDYDVDQKILVGLLLIMTLVALFWTRLWSKFYIALIVGAAIVVVHGVLRAPEESMPDSSYGSFLNVADSPRGEHANV